MVAPGTPLREGIDNIVHSRTGGLIVVGEAEEVSFLFSGGIRLDVDYTPGAALPGGEDGRRDRARARRRPKIVWANVQLMPDPTILSMETGPATARPSASRSRPTRW